MQGITYEGRRGAILLYFSNPQQQAIPFPFRLLQRCHDFVGYSPRDPKLALRDVDHQSTIGIRERPSPAYMHEQMKSNHPVHLHENQRWQKKTTITKTRQLP